VVEFVLVDVVLFEVVGVGFGFFVVDGVDVVGGFEFDDVEGLEWVVWGIGCGVLSFVYCCGVGDVFDDESLCGLEEWDLE